MVIRYKTPGKRKIFRSRVIYEKLVCILGCGTNFCPHQWKLSAEILHVYASGLHHLGLRLDCTCHSNFFYFLEY